MPSRILREGGYKRYIQFPGKDHFQVKFLFTSPAVDVVEKMIVYGVIDFFSDFGGFIGLFLGASCITVIDVAAVYLEKAAERNRRLRNVGPIIP